MAETQDSTVEHPLEEVNDRYTIKHRPHARQWEVLDPRGELVCVAAYRRGARALLRHFGKEWNEI